MVEKPEASAASTSPIPELGSAGGDEELDVHEEHGEHGDTSMSVSEEPQDPAAGGQIPARRTRRQLPGRNQPKTSCLRCKVMKVRCESSQDRPGICRR